MWFVVGVVLLGLLPVCCCCCDVFIDAVLLFALNCVVGVVLCCCWCGVVLLLVWCCIVVVVVGILVKSFLLWCFLFIATNPTPITFKASTTIEHTLAQEALSQICEFSEAGITVRGSYFAPNKEPKEGDDRKLYLAIEASSERALNKAKSEVTRLIKEELVRLVRGGCFWGWFEG